MRKLVLKEIKNFVKLAIISAEQENKKKEKKHN